MLRVRTIQCLRQVRYRSGGPEKPLGKLKHSQGGVEDNKPKYKSGHAARKTWNADTSKKPKNKQPKGQKQDQITRRAFEDNVETNQEEMANIVKTTKKSSIFSPELKKLKRMQFDNKKIEGHDNVSMTQNLLKSSAGTPTDETYFDPENSRLNLSKSNAALYKEIVAGAKDRLLKRFDEPSEKWKETLTKFTNDFQGDFSKYEIVTKIRNLIRHAAISPDIIHNPISVGDLVTLQEDTLDVHMVVSIPHSLDSNSYTVVSFAGVITYVHKSGMKFRFPNVIPPEFHPIIESFVQLEHKHLDIAPIGVPDSKFSRSIESLPQELQSKYQETSNIGDVNSDQASTEEAEPNFLVAQASSQLLTNTNVKTFQVSNEARKVYSQSLVDLSVSSFDGASEMTSRLDKIHRFLQYDEHGDLINTPRNISMFDILHYLEDDNFEKIDNYLENRKLSATHLGKSLPVNIDSRSTSYPISTYLALLLALGQQNRSWNIERTHAYTPQFVTVFPRTKIESTEATINYLRFKNGNREFADYCLKKMAGDTGLPLPPFYKNILQLFKDYVIGNVLSDTVAQTLLVSILRFIEAESNFERPYNYSSDFAKARSYDLILSLEGKDVVSNPIYWSMASALPKSEVNTMSELSYEYYDYIDQSLKPTDLEGKLDESIGLVDGPERLVGILKPLDDFYLEDPLADIRQDFGDAPVYCIDSASAHEIDDGISIQEKDGDYVLSVHVANPTSYIKPDSILASIAFNKSTTTYLPEGPTTMLPKLIGSVAGLGKDGKPTRTVVTQYKLDKKLIDDQIKLMLDSSSFEPKPEVMTTLAKQMKDSVNVFVSTVKNFPQNFTYDNVNKLLDDKAKIENFRKGVSDDDDFNNLFKLSNISRLLHEVRVSTGSLAFDRYLTTCEVHETENINEETKLEVDGTTMELSLKDTRLKITRSYNLEKSKSVNLVTEMMIFANSSFAGFAAKNEIPLVNRAQELNFHPNLRSEIEELMKKKRETGLAFTPDEARKLSEHLHSAKLLVTPTKHESLGLDYYAWSTSPLRRFIDMVNHWRIEQFLLNKESSQSFLNNKSSLEYVVNHLQHMTLTSKKAQAFSTRFWDGIFLREYLNLLHEGKIDNPIKFQLLIKTDPRLGNFVNVDVVGFDARAKIDITPTFMDAYEAENMKAGQIFTSDRWKITTIDFIENELIFQYV